MNLDPDSQAFVLHCGEMGSRWGFNRTVGQICALLVITEEPLNAEQIAEALHISRGNVSMGLKELQSWRLIQLSHKPGDRKEYFTAGGSIWEMGLTIVEERRKREIDPTLSLLRSQLLSDGNKSDYAQGRLQEIHDLLELLTNWASTLSTLQPNTLQSLMKLGTGVTKVLEFTQGKKSAKK